MIQFIESLKSGYFISEVRGQDSVYPSVRWSLGRVCGAFSSFIDPDISRNVFTLYTFIELSIYNFWTYSCCTSKKTYFKRWSIGFTSLPMGFMA